MNGGSNFSRLVYLASAASGVVGGIVYVARQVVTKEDLKEVKCEIEQDLKNTTEKIEKDLKELGEKLDSIDKF